jgi:hypothetical protein
MPLSFKTRSSLIKGQSQLIKPPPSPLMLLPGKFQERERARKKEEVEEGGKMNTQEEA